MKDKLFELFEASGELQLVTVAMNISIAALIGFLIFISYFITHRGTIYSKKFNASLVVLTVLTATVMTVIGNNIALSLGMVGALSIVRFRTAIKDSRDTVYIFWTIIVGICCGVGDFSVALVGSGVTFIVLLILGSIKNDNRMLIIVRGARNKQSIVTGYIFKLFKGKAILRVNNTTPETMELIYEVSSSLLKKVEKDASVVDALHDLGGLEYVNIVMQNDEISN